MSICSLRDGTRRVRARFSPVSSGIFCAAFLIGSVPLTAQAYSCLFDAGGAGNTTWGSTTPAGHAEIVACGAYANASGINSSAFGVRADASGTNSTALGYYSTASGTASTATGYESQALGSDSIATGSWSRALGVASIATGGGSLAEGAYSIATGVGSRAASANTIAIGRNSEALGANTTAIGHGARASNANTTALGYLANARHVNSMALGAGVYTTAPNQVAIGTASNTYTLAGLSSPDSRAAQSGPVQLVTTDAQGNLATDGGSTVLNLQGFEGAISANREGIAMAIAIEAPYVPPSQNFALSGGVGSFDGSSAFAFSGAMRLSEVTQLNAALGVGMDSGRVAGRLGLTFGW